MERFELISRYHRQKSFYKKAHIIVTGDWHTLESYSTLVMRYCANSKTLEIYGNWSATTRRHQWEFMHWCDNEFGTDFVNAYWYVCKNEKIKSFPKFLEAVDEIDFENRTYKLHNGKRFKYI